MKIYLKDFLRVFRYFGIFCFRKCWLKEMMNLKTPGI